MNRRLGILLLIAGAWAVGGSKSGSAAEPENPYPYGGGKAEFKAKEVQDVVQLLRVADQYRDRCVALFEARQPLSHIDHFGREAKAWYREALEREPSNAYATLSIGYVDLIRGRATTNQAGRENHFAVAMSRFHEALEQRPGYARAHLYMAQVRALREQYDRAEQDLRLILNSDIEDSQVHSWMAYVLFKTDRPSEAHKHLARAIELDDPSASAKWSRKHQK